MNGNSYDNFIRRLDNSRMSTFLVAEYLHKRGYTTYIPAFDYRPPNSNWQDHVDNGDLYIWKEREASHRIDVKHVKKNFTCREDYPHNTIFISTAQSIKQADPKPLAYVVLNRAATHIAIIWWKTHGVWEKSTVYASNVEKPIVVMQCPVEHADFRALDVRGLND